MLKRIQGQREPKKPFSNINMVNLSRTFSALNRAMKGVEIVRISPGDGKSFPKAGQTVHMHYVGTLQSNGNKFDSSRDRGKPFTCVIGVGQVIKYIRH